MGLAASGQSSELKLEATLQPEVLASPEASKRALEIRSAADTPGDLVLKRPQLPKSEAQLLKPSTS